jgi:hypothetical protein
MDQSLFWVRRLSAVAVLLFGLVSAAAARPVYWELQGVAFDDGGSVSGNFIYDPDNQQFSSFSLSIAGGNTQDFPAVVMTQANSQGYLSNDPSNSQPTLIFQLDDGSMRQLRMTPATTMTSFGGTVALDLNTAHGSSGGLECYNCGPFRIITAGSLAGSIVAQDGAALPALDWRGLAVLALGLFGIAAYGRRYLKR